VVNGPLLAALRQAAIATSSESQGVDMTFIGGSIRMDARTDEVGESSVSMIADCDLACGETLTMRVDNRYVREFCGVVSPEASVKLLFGRVVEPLLLEVEDGYQYVIMPMAVDRG
jgi:DNA polymerase-3 subunit beta